MSIAQSERQALCDLLESKGPLAPTLCEGWTTSDLAAHLYIRENKLLSSPGIILPAFAGVTQRAMDKAKADLGYDGLIKKVRSGPPLPMKLADVAVNSVEYFIHHEDVRRAEGEITARVDPAIDAVLWKRVKGGGKFMSRRFKSGGLVLESDLGTVVARPGDTKVVVKGGPQELMLLLFGRLKAALVELDGPDSLVADLRTTSFGI